MTAIRQRDQRIAAVKRIDTFARSEILILLIQRCPRVAQTVCGVKIAHVWGCSILLRLTLASRPTLTDHRQHPSGVGG
jgi:hypothetical protein